MDDNKLIGLQRAEFNRAEIMGSYSNLVQVAIVIISMITIFISVPPLCGYLISVTNLILAIVWIYLLDKSKSSHSVAERARRAIIFSKGLGIKLSSKSYTDLKMLFSVNENDGTKYEDPNYFTASASYGNKKLAEIIEESSFWSKHLYKMSAQRYWRYFVAILLISIIGLLLLPILNIGSADILIAQVFSLILIWVITGNIFTTAMSFTSAASFVDNIETRLDSMAAHNEFDDVLIIVSDYNALVGSTPIIPSNLYDRNKDRLNKLWAERT